MPPLDEGSLLFTPSLLPSASLTEAQHVIARQDVAIRSVPEVKSVVGKVGRVESALDPAPIGMFATIVIQKPETNVPGRAVHLLPGDGMAIPPRHFRPSQRRSDATEPRRIAARIRSNRIQDE